MPWFVVQTTWEGNAAYHVGAHAPFPDEAAARAMAASSEIGGRPLPVARGTGPPRRTTGVIEATDLAAAARGLRGRGA